MAPPIPKGFIMVKDSRVAVSEIVTYYDDTSNGAHCVTIVTKDKGRIRELGISCSTIDARINEAQYEEKTQ
jgi:hypothetical protein